MKELLTSAQAATWEIVNETDVEVPYTDTP